MGQMRTELFLIAYSRESVESAPRSEAEAAHLARGDQLSADIPFDMFTRATSRDAARCRAGRYAHVAPSCQPLPLISKLIQKATDKNIHFFFLNMVTTYQHRLITPEPSEILKSKLNYFF